MSRERLARTLATPKVVRKAAKHDASFPLSPTKAKRTTFGVANVRTSLPRLSVTPRYVATHEMGEGFAEIAARILASRA